MLDHNYISLYFILVFFLGYPQLANGVAMNSKYYIFSHYNEQPSSMVNNIHPFLKGGSQNFIALTHQEEDMLKVAFYYDASLIYRSILMYTHNPSQKNFTGIPARYISNAKGGGIMFADGTVLYSYLPLDARPLGTSEWMYEMRWRRVYKNYYLVTVFRGSGEATKENLMTERDGKDLTPILGDSSVDRDLEPIGGSISADMILEYRTQEGKETKYITFHLIPVYEKDLPPDFPPGLVRWIP